MKITFTYDFVLNIYKNLINTHKTNHIKYFKLKTRLYI